MYDEAILEYKKVIESNPNLPDVHYNLGVVYREKGMLLQAKREVSLYKKMNRRN
jgi:tetratricopeptide (TPR) repeat protein